ncbi:uncharacterized protein Bfra_004549 [Botrytis fragariae]|uniref:Uncharacterized protein n=1 Tax=Botrytis fragariae TaxID=1964551 RepID=A0A8H6AVG9_9HELO|nr:uncharacterized protein Bfra_004549 [Botrytis fragariae]KAF5874538.1 hypothetical protein Bfra_004549 [Botrytis fragariae]
MTINDNAANDVACGVIYPPEAPLLEPSLEFTSTANTTPYEKAIGCYLDIHHFVPGETKEYQKDSTKKGI